MPCARCYKNVGHKCGGPCLHRKKMEKLCSEMQSFFVPRKSHIGLECGGVIDDSFLGEQTCFKQVFSPITFFHLNEQFFFSFATKYDQGLTNIFFQGAHISYV